MKTAEEITKALEKETQDRDDDMTYLMHVERPRWYTSYWQTLRHIREYLLKVEYYQNKDIQLEGIEKALRWVLEEDKENLK